MIDIGNTTNITASSYTYWSSTERSCDTCSHKDICKYEPDFRKAMKEVNDKIAWVKVKTISDLMTVACSCRYYSSNAYQITYDPPTTTPYFKPPYEITCCNSNATKENANE